MDLSGFPESDRELASLCSNWQQLDMLKRRRQAKLDGTLEKKEFIDMTRSEKLVWYRHNGGKQEVEEDRALVKQSSNYKQLELLRGNSALGQDDWEKTRSKRLTWYRNGGSELVDQQRDLARQCSNWQQYHLLTRGSTALKHQEEDEEEAGPTRSQALLWYRRGGKEVVEDTKAMASNSENWLQYKLTRDASKHANQLYNAVQDSYSEFKSKAALSDYMTKMRIESRLEREEIRESSRTRNVRDSMTKTAFNIHQQPYCGLELEDSASRKMQYKMRAEAMEEELRCTTESMIMAKTEYLQTAREMALQAYKEDMEAVAASRMSRKTMVVQENASTAA